VDRARLQRDLRNYGPALTAWRRIGNVAERVLGLQVYMVSLRTEVGTEYPTPPGVELVDLTEAAALAQARRPELDPPPGGVTAAFARGDRGRGAVAGAEIVSYVWRATDGFTPHQDHIWVEYPPDSYYSHGMFTAPAARGNHSSSALVNSVLTDMIDAGRGREFGMTAIHNLSTRSSYRFPWSTLKRDGTRSSAAGLAGFVRWGSRAWCFRSRAVQALGFRFVATPWKAPR
jgi:hypothetical protein